MGEQTSGARPAFTHSAGYNGQLATPRFAIAIATLQSHRFHLNGHKDRWIVVSMATLVQQGQILSVI